MPSQNIIIRALCILGSAYFATRYYDSFLSPKTDHPFKIVNVADRGKGAVSTRNIEQGEMVFKEAPLFLVHSHNFQDPAVNIHSIVSGLNATSRASFFALSHPVASDDPNIALAIFQTNSIRVADGIAGIFPLFSRLNHGCSKAINSIYSWRKEGILVVHALKPIRKGEELLTAYIDTKRPREKRRADLYETYGFDCLCSVCSLHPPDARRSDSRLSSMVTLQAEFATWEEGKLDGKEAVRLAKRIWALGEKEGYWIGRGKLAEDVVNIAAIHEDDRAVQAWAELSGEWYAYEFGYDSEEVDRMRFLSSDPTHHGAWATREAQRVGSPDMAL